MENRKPIWLSDAEAQWLIDALKKTSDPFRLVTRAISVRDQLRDFVERTRELAARANADSYWDIGDNNRSANAAVHDKDPSEREAKPKKTQRQKFLTALDSLPTEERAALIKALQGRV